MAEFFNDVDLVKVNIGVIRAASASLSDVNQQVWHYNISLCLPLETSPDRPC